MAELRIIHRALAAGILAAGALAGGSGLAQAQPATGAASHAAALVRCPRAVLYDVPGSEQGNQTTNLGVLTNSVDSHLRGFFGASDIKVVKVTYPAVPVWEGVDNAGGTGFSYLPSRAVGVARLASLISAQLASPFCKGTVIAIVGDHQGADVVGQYLATVPAAIASHIAAAAMISDPRFNPADAAVDAGSFNPALRSLFRTFPVWTTPSSRSLQGARPLFSATVNYKTLNVCNALDPVCNYSLAAGQACFGTATWPQWAVSIAQGVPVLLPFAQPSCPGLLYGQTGSDDIIPGHPVNTTGVARYLEHNIILATTWLQVSAGGAHTCGIRANHTLWCWGLNNAGQLGIASNTSQKLPVQVGTAHDWLQVSAGGAHTCGIRAGGALYCWGLNSSGQLGIASFTSQNTPQLLSTTWLQVSAGGAQTCAVRSNHTLWCWGRNTSGELGIGSNLNKNTPQQVGVATNWRQVSAGDRHTCAVQFGFTLWCWGSNLRGQLGIGSFTSKNTPQQVASSSWVQVAAGGAHTCAVRFTGSLWCWGDNTFGQLGIGPSGAKTTPQQVGSLTTWRFVSAADVHTCALQANHTLWCWGSNFFGQLGIGNHVSHSTPQQAGFLPPSVEVSAGGDSSCAITSGLSLWCWGSNLAGQLGIGNTISQDHPVPVL
jgi:alpha-tubulin suppressor-like RCC1 family protein